jgi:outer membrane lipoprotein SlyB
MNLSYRREEKKKGAVSAVGGSEVGGLARDKMMDGNGSAIPAQFSIGTFCTYFQGDTSERQYTYPKERKKRLGRR